MSFARISFILIIATLTALFVSLMTMSLHYSIGRLSPDLSSFFSEPIPFTWQLSKSDIIYCIDNLTNQYRFRILQSDDKPELKSPTLPAETPLHIAFIGDSRIRQFFFTFLLTLPQHDLKLTPTTNNLHSDRQMKSEFLNLLVTFWWRPNILGKIGNNLLETIQHWIVSPFERPHIILIGIALHDMLAENGADHGLYRQRLLEMHSLLQQLSKNSRVIWLSVHPTYDTVGKSWKSTELYAENIYRYNSIARDIFSKGRVNYWESSIPVATEYIRACALNLKDEGGDLWGITPYMKCQDNLHHGSVISLETSQMFLNMICNTEQ